LYVESGQEFPSGLFQKPQFRESKQNKSTSAKFFCIWPIDSQFDPCYFMSPVFGVLFFQPANEWDVSKVFLVAVIPAACALTY
jgi:hypothetical protein